MRFLLKEIAELLQGEIVGDAEISIENLSKIQEAEKGSITFLSNPKYEPFIYTTRASAVLVQKNFNPEKAVHTSLVKVEDPYLGFTILLDEYHKRKIFEKSGIEQPVFIGAGSTYGDHVYLGAFTYIGEHVTIGNNVKIYPNSYIGDYVHIGNDSIIRAGVRIYENCTIGNFCVVHSGAVIGCDGFGFAPQKDKTYKKIPQTGNVVLEDYVEIGGNTVIDRATIGSTIIHRGVKLDNLIQIAHNVEIGNNTVMASQSGVSGSTKIGENCVIAGQVGIVGHIELADGIMIGAQSGVTKTFKEKGKILLGSPAFDRKDCVKSYVIFKKLPDLQDKIFELDKHIHTSGPE